MKKGEISLHFLDLPPEVGAAPLMAPPLGTREEVRRSIATCFSGIRFDGDDRAVVPRPGYTLTIQIDSDEPPGFVAVNVQGDPSSLVALRRLSQQTGWRPFEARTRQAFDLTHGAIASVRAETPDEEARPWGAAARGLGLAAALALAVGWLSRSGTAGLPWIRETPQALEAQVLRDLRELEVASGYLGALNDRCYASPEIMAVPGSYPPVMAAGLPGDILLHERFRAPVRYHYRFEFRGSDPCGTSSSLVFVRPSFKTFAIAAIPEEGAPEGLRSFAYYSYRVGGAYVRADRQVPSADDTRIEFR